MDFKKEVGKMDLKDLYLDNRRLKSLLNEIENIGSEELKGELKEYLENNGRNGEYLINIFSFESLNELKEHKNKILSLIFIGG